LKWFKATYSRFEYDEPAVTSTGIGFAKQSGFKIQVRKKRKEKFTLFSDHNGSLLRRQPGAKIQVYMVLKECTSQAS